MALTAGIWDPKTRVANIKGANSKSWRHPKPLNTRKRPRPLDPSTLNTLKLVFPVHGFGSRAREQTV